MIDSGSYKEIKLHARQKSFFEKYLYAQSDIHTISFRYCHLDKKNSRNPIIYTIMYMCDYGQHYVYNNVHVLLPQKKFKKPLLSARCRHIGPWYQHLTNFLFELTLCSFFYPFKISKTLSNKSCIYIYKMGGGGMLF